MFLVLLHACMPAWSIFSEPLFILFKINLLGLLSGLKVGWMTRTIWVTWRVTFLEGQVGLIHKLNYLDYLDVRISHVL